MLLRSTVTYIRPLAPSDARALLDLRERNQDFLQAFEPRRPPGFLTHEYQLHEIRRGEEERSADKAFPFGIFDGSSDDLIGRVALGNVVRSAWQNATLGYFVAQECSGRGHCTRAVGLALEFAFVHADLHRVQAAVMPRNRPSVRVLEKNRFRYEGMSPRYLCINGAWEDHDLYAMTLEEWGGPGTI